MQLFSATLDTLAWVILLLLFELGRVIPTVGGFDSGFTVFKCSARRLLSWHFLAILANGSPYYSELLSGDACSRVTEVGP